jgi:(E)-4-hydroxy-3-methylbut-2-enyl-diphosphate synthase
MQEGPDWNYPIHLGVTEAGDGEDGRIKSAIGIGSLLSDGIGDTIRVSLTEDAVYEIPVAQALVEAVRAGTACTPLPCGAGAVSYDPFTYRRRASQRMTVQGHPLGAAETVRVFTSQAKLDALAHKLGSLGEFQPEVAVERSGVLAVDPLDEKTIAQVNAMTEPVLVTIPDGYAHPVIASYRLLAARLDERHPILLKDTFVPSTDPEKNFTETLLTAATNIGSLLCDGIGDAVLIQGEEAPGQSLRLAYNILQAAGVRIFKTDYVACPSCGRTLFNLQTTTQRIRAATGHLKGVRIAVMGCIVNGPGEMADADFGYVGGAPGKINLYVGKTPVQFNIPEDEAVERLIGLIDEHGKWVAAPAARAEN